MKFLYYPNPTPQLEIEGEKFKYLFKVRRIQVGEIVPVRTLKDDLLYLYQVEKVEKRRGVLKLVERREEPVLPPRYLHLGWCIVDPKTIEKALPHLNEIGVSKISFIYCDRSQHNFRLRLDRIERILIESCQQCGRSRLPEIEVIESSDRFAQLYPETVRLDFGGGEVTSSLKRVIVGPEGGFTDRERQFFPASVGFKGFILKSETAACAVAAKILL
jgi:16S rRNA (uracil1498-N3)-methyltransferase